MSSAGSDEELPQIVKPESKVSMQEDNRVARHISQSVESAVFGRCVVQGIIPVALIASLVTMFDLLPASTVPN